MKKLLSFCLFFTASLNVSAQLPTSPIYKNNTATPAVHCTADNSCNEQKESNKSRKINANGTKQSTNHPQSNGSRRDTSTSRKSSTTSDATRKAKSGAPSNSQSRKNTSTSRTHNANTQ